MIRSIARSVWASTSGGTGIAAGIVKSCEQFYTGTVRPARSASFPERINVPCIPTTRPK